MSKTTLKNFLVPYWILWLILLGCVAVVAYFQNRDIESRTADFKDALGKNLNALAIERLHQENILEHIVENVLNPRQEYATSSVPRTKFNGIIDMHLGDIRALLSSRKSATQTTTGDSDAAPDDDPEDALDDLSKALLAMRENLSVRFRNDEYDFNPTYKNWLWLIILIGIGLAIYQGIVVIIRFYLDFADLPSVSKIVEGMTNAADVTIIASICTLFYSAAATDTAYLLPVVGYLFHPLLFGATLSTSQFRNRKRECFVLFVGYLLCVGATVSFAYLAAERSQLSLPLLSMGVVLFAATIGYGVRKASGFDWLRPALPQVFEEETP